MDNIQSSFSGYIDKLYEKSTYLDKYGGSVIVTTVTLFIFFLLFSYYYIQGRVKPIKADWDNQKCSPAVMPFAGFINAGPGESKIEYTAKNFSGCVNSILSSIIGSFTSPIDFVSNMLGQFFVLLAKAIQKIRELFNKIRLAIKKIVVNIMGRMVNVVIQLQRVTMKIKAIMEKAQGVMTTSLYTVMASYLALKSSLGAMLEIIIKFLVILAAMVIIAWIFPWTWPFAATVTALFIAIAIPTGIIAGGLVHILDITSDNLPNDPKKGCFDGNTVIETMECKKKIIDIKLGDILKDGGIVTSTFKIKKGKKEIFDLNGIIVTGCHDVYIKDVGWIPVSQHPSRTPINNYSKQFVYCLNTTSKQIIINDTTFADWDEVDEFDLEELKNIYPEKFRNSKSISLKRDAMHKYLEGGFCGNTKIKLKNGKLVSLKDLDLNDELHFGGEILGIVEISSKNIEQIKKYKINNNAFIGGPNLVVDDKYLGKFNTMNLGIPIEFDNNKLYHIITDTGKMMIKNTVFFDYNGSLEQTLWLEDNILDIL
jgi:hypothetical protein